MSCCCEIVMVIIIVFVIITIVISVSCSGNISVSCCGNRRPTCRRLLRTHRYLPPFTAVLALMAPAVSYVLPPRECCRLTALFVLPTQYFWGPLRVSVFLFCFFFLSCFRGRTYSAGHLSTGRTGKLTQSGCVLEKGCSLL